MTSPSPDAGPVTEPVFAERLWPSPGFWALLPVLAVMVAVSLLPVSAPLAVGAALVVGVLAGAALVVASTVVTVVGGELRAGPARVPVGVLGRPAAFAGAEATQERGPRLDARAYLALRGWVGPVVRVPLDDPADPTPYWLVSTRRPDELVAALVGAGAGARGLTENPAGDDDGRAGP